MFKQKNRKYRKKKKKTSVKSVHLGRSLVLSIESDSGLKLEIFHPMFDRVKKGQNHYGS